MEFKAGKFVTFVAKIAFFSGDLDCKLTVGEKVQFDGYTAKYNGKTLKAYNLQAAVRGNWLVPEGSTLEPTRKKNFPTVTTSEDDLIVGPAKIAKKVIRGVSASEAAEVAEAQSKDAKVVKAFDQKKVIESAKKKLFNEKTIEGITLKNEVGTPDASGAEAFTTQNQGGKEVGRIQHNRKIATASSVPTTPEPSEVQKALAKREETKRLLEERKKNGTAPVIAKKEVDSPAIPKGFPVNGHWKSRLAWLKMHNENKLLKNVYSMSPSSFQNLMKKEFSAVKFE